MADSPRTFRHCREDVDLAQGSVGLGYLLRGNPLVAVGTRCRDSGPATRGAEPCQSGPIAACLVEQRLRSCTSDFEPRIRISARRLHGDSVV